MQGCCIWLTGLPCSGKTTIARAIEPKLRSLGLGVHVLDGDEVRERFSKGLGFSREDRDTNVRRISYVARAVAHTGGVSIVCAVSPYRGARDEARREIGRFLEVHVAPKLETCVERDVKGHYKKALAGEIQHFTGVSDPYEEPLAPELRFHTDRMTLDQCVEALLAKMGEMGFLPSALPAPHGGVLVNRVAQGARRAELEAESQQLPHLEVDADTADDVENIATGAFSPLTGFLGRADVESLVARKTLASGLRWTIPILLSVTEATAARLGSRFALTRNGRPFATMTADSVWTLEKAALCSAVFGTQDPAHPGVAQTMALAPICVGGPIEMFETPQTQHRRLRMTPHATREMFARRGYKSVAAFQTRNVPHLGHEHLQRIALQMCDGLLVHPVIGPKKPGDFRDEVILASYETLVGRYLPSDRVVLSTLHTRMRYAGPMEAIHHAIVRQNYGCSHILIGRDHAGVGKYYDPYAAQRIFTELDGLEIRPIPIGEAFFCKVCDGMATTRDCAHAAEERISVSATAVRAALSTKGKMKHQMRDEVLTCIRQFEEPLVEEPGSVTPKKRRLKAPAATPQPLVAAKV